MLFVMFGAFPCPHTDLIHLFIYLFISADISLIITWQLGVQHPQFTFDLGKCLNVLIGRCAAGTTL